MSWWPVPDSPGDITGDGPADAVDGAFFSLVKARTHAGAQKPLLSEVVRALDDGLPMMRDRIENGAMLQGISVQGVEAATSAPADVAAAVRAALTELAETYEHELRRRPRIAEALYAFTFAFGGAPESFVSGPVPPSIRFMPH